MDQGAFSQMDAIEGVFVCLEQAAGVGWRAEQVRAFAQGGVVLGRDKDGIAMAGDDLDGVVVLVDPLDQREEFLACLAVASLQAPAPCRRALRIDQGMSTRRGCLPST